MVVNLQAWIAYAPRTIEVVLVLLLAWVFSGWWMFNLETPQSQQTIGMQEQSSVSSVNMGDWVKIMLFGKQTSTPVVQKPIAVSKPMVASRLNIKLLGTVVAGARSAAVVVLGGGRKQQVFFLGDSMQAGVTLKSVEADAIVVDHQGKSERILLNKNKAISGATIAASAVVQPKIAQRVVSRSNLNQQVRDFPKLLSQARVVPHFNQGKADGFLISDIVPNSLYQQVGLKNGDIIRKVNGQAVTSAEQAMKMYQALQNAASIDLELERGGTIVPIHYAIQ